MPRYAEGEFAGYVGTATDIHERKQMEDALRTSEAGFRDLADSAPVMIWTTDERGSVTFVNAGWLAYTGTTLEEELGETWALGVHPEQASEVVSGWYETLAKREPWEREYRLRARDGEYRWISERGVPRFKEGGFVGYVGTAVDIHERKLMEGQLLEVYQREHTIAETLQRSLLPERLPRIEGLEIAARYLPAGRGRRDRRRLVRRARAARRPRGARGRRRGRPRAACRGGHGPAAQRVARLRRWRELAGRGAAARQPAGDDRARTTVMATVLYLVLDPETGELTLRQRRPPAAAGAGAPTGVHFLEGGRAVPIGAVEPVLFREASAALPPGAALLLYTDGLVERRDEPLERAPRRAGRGRRRRRGRARGPLRRRAGRRDRRRARAQRRRGAAGGAAAAGREPSAIRFTLPAEPESLPGLRRRLARFLHAAGADDAETYEITLTICEAAGNAIEHAYGPGDATFDVEASLDADELVATVSDRGNWRERRGAHRGRGLNIIEGLMDDVEVSTEGGWHRGAHEAAAGAARERHDDARRHRGRAARRPPSSPA